jgi:hypothetical protein
MALTKSPNKSKSIERKWISEANKRFKLLKSEMIKLPLNAEVLNVSSAQRIEIDRFMFEFELLAKQLVLNDPWQNKFQTAAYQRGIERVNQDMKNAFRRPTADFFAFTHAKSLISMNLPSNKNEIDFLHSRANSALDKWVILLLEETKSIIHEQLGYVSLDDIHEAIAKRIGVTTSYSHRIAATEVAQASQRSVIRQTQELSAVSDEDLDVLWITVDDNHVRRLHASWHKLEMSSEQAARNITISPFNCRCGLKAIVKGDITDEDREKFAKERKQLLLRIT